MEDEKIKEIFENFTPDLSSDLLFIEKLQRNLEAVELIKQHSECLRRRNKIAVWVSAFCGFVAGLLFMSLIPVMDDWMATICFRLPYFSGDFGAEVLHFITWAVAAIVCSITAYNAYIITLSKVSITR